MKRGLSLALVIFGGASLAWATGCGSESAVDEMHNALGKGYDLAGKKEVEKAGNAFEDAGKYAVKSDDWRKPIKDVKVTNAPPAGELPPDAAKDLLVEKKPAAGRDWAETQFNWAPTELAHQPLYFDELALERYGQTVAPRLQPVISGAHFFGTFAILPYKMGLDRAHDCVYTLGHYRPGSCAPCVRQGLPFETDAALFEAGTWVALALLLP